MKCTKKANFYAEIVKFWGNFYTSEIIVEESWGKKYLGPNAPLGHPPPPLVAPPIQILAHTFGSKNSKPERYIFLSGLAFLCITDPLFFLWMQKVQLKFTFMHPTGCRSTYCVKYSMQNHRYCVATKNHNIPMKHLNIPIAT